jgi:hypothetical protein
MLLKGHEPTHTISSCYMMAENMKIADRESPMAIVWLGVWLNQFSYVCVGSSTAGRCLVQFAVL